MNRLPGRFALPAVLLLLGGCAPAQSRPAKPLLAPVQTGPDSAALDIYFIRCAAGDPRLNEALWKAADEQAFPSQSRAQWNRNGFRLGIITGHIPPVLADLLEIKEKPPEPAPGQPKDVSNLQEEPRVVQRYLQLRPGQRGEIVASMMYDEWPLLMCESGQVCGETYHQAQGQFGLHLADERDGRVRLELTPEITYGDNRPRWTGSQGVMRLEGGRPRRDFDDLAIKATLIAGQYLVVSNLPSRPGSLGHRFFTGRRAGQDEQKLLVIRLAQTQHDDLLLPQTVLPLDVTAAEK